MATIEQNGLMQYRDGSGNMHLLYPITRAELVDGLDEALGALVINDLTTGGASAALSAEMGKVLGRRPNPNLPHNWYFRNAVNQRGLTEYAGAGYTIDRWRLTSDAGRLVVGDEGITLSSTSETAIAVLRQVIDSPSRLHGETVTISALLSDGSLASSTVEVPTSVMAGATAAVTQAVFDHLSSGHHLALYMSGDGSLLLQLRVPALGELTCVAVKLELGSVQTLAHQDSGGNWVLNEVPDYGEELAKCQRYYQLFSSADARPAALADYRPAMRANPATGTIQIDGVTYYYADANL